MKTSSTTMISLAIKSVSALFEYLSRCALMMVPFLTFQTADGLTFFKWCLAFIFLTPRPPIARAPHATECPCTRKKSLHQEKVPAQGKCKCTRKIEPICCKSLCLKTFNSLRMRWFKADQNMLLRGCLFRTMNWQFWSEFLTEGSGMGRKTSVEDFIFYFHLVLRQFLKLSCLRMREGNIEGYI